MSAFITATSLVALAEIGDKTQLLSIMLAACYRKPLQIIVAIFAATLVNHACAAYVGHWVGSEINMHWLAIGLSLSFIAIGLWVLVPDTLENLQCKQGKSVFLTTFAAFFIAEMGDKTQIATIALGARYADLTMVVLGTTVGMMLANIPAVYCGDAVLKRIPLKWVRITVSALFVALGVSGLIGALAS